MLIRPVQESDYPSLTALYNLVYPHDVHSVKELRFHDASFQLPYRFGRFVAVQGDAVVASSNYQQFAGAYHPQKFYLELFVHPEQRGKGVGTALYQQLEQSLASYQPISYSIQVEETETHAIASLQRRGFVELKRDWQQRLCVQDMDRGWLERIQPVPPLRFTTFAEFDNDEARRRQYCEFYNLVRLDVPRAEPPTPWGYDEFKKHVFDAPDYAAETLFLAMHGDAFIAMTQCFVSESSNDLYTGLTAVKREYRGRGIAQQLKLRAIQYALEQGIDHIYTDNDSKNVEMLAINAKLGFERLPAWLSMQKTF